LRGRRADLRGRHRGPREPGRALSASVLRLRSSAGTPWGAWFLGIGALGAGLVALLHLDRLPFAICLFKHLTGFPCPTCGSTRALGRLAQLDLAGALAMNPLATLAAFVLVAWGLADLALLTRGRALDLELKSPLPNVVRAGAVLAVLVNWAYLVAAGR
jgi:hypothetical protein